jgi:hypothetical protein
MAWMCGGEKRRRNLPGGGGKRSRVQAGRWCGLYGGGGSKAAVRSTKGRRWRDIVSGFPDLGGGRTEEEEGASLAPPFSGNWAPGG